MQIFDSDIWRFYIQGEPKFDKHKIGKWMYFFEDKDYDNDISCNEKSCILCAIDIYTSVSLDFVDCLLIAYHRINNENIFSFDKKLNKHLD